MNEKKMSWNRLDNAAKIFPPTSSKRDTKVFRFACQLNEKVNPKQLQAALDQTIEIFPFYQSVLKKGLFWYYLEETPIRPVVKEENEPPCSLLYDKNVKSLLFEVTYFRQRINLEIYHALSDGAGALQFLRVLVYHYLMLCHKELSDENLSIDYDASMTQKLDDSFNKYYKKNTSHIKKHPLTFAYELKGSKIPENRIQILEGIMPADEVLKKAHEFNASLTAFISGIYMYAMSETMSIREKARPIILTIPVNMRKYFPSETARNFFTVFEVSYLFTNDNSDLRQVIGYITEYFKKELTQERMGIRMNSLAALEHNIFARAVPRSIKDFFLRIGNYFASKGITAAVSNIGRVDMPPALAKYISYFDVFVSTSKMQIGMCSFQNNLTISFSSAFTCTEIQKNFFRTLTGLGIPVTIASNEMKR